jgi:WD40 repeat protein
MPRPRPTDDEDDDARPRRRRRREEDDEDDDAPRRKGRSGGTGGGSGPLLWVGIGLAAVVGLGAVGGAAWWLTRAKPAAVANNAPPGPAATPDGNPQAKPGPGSAGKKDEPPRLAPTHKFKTGIREISKVFISDDGVRVAAASDGLGNKSVTEVWDLRPVPKKVRDFPKLVRALSPDGKLVAISGTDGLDVVEVETGKAVATVPGVGRTTTFISPSVLLTTVFRQSPAGEKVWQLTASRFDVTARRSLGEFLVPRFEFSAQTAVAAGGKELVIADEKPLRVEVWNVDTGTKVRGAAIAGAPATAGLHNFAVSADGKRMTVGWSSARPLGVYDTATGAEIGALAGYPITSAFLPGRDLVLGHMHWTTASFDSADGWRAHDPAKKAVVADLPGGYLAPAISADGKVMVTMTARAAPDLLVWDLTRVP